MCFTIINCARSCRFRVHSNVALSAVPAVGSPASQTDDTGSPSSSLYQSQDVWRRVRVNPSVLTQWTANLRMV
jgi:hypothetical protein